MLCCAVLCCAVLCWACRWGYIDIKDLEDVVANYSKADLPLDGLWVDIEAMNNRFQVFTFDKGEGGGAVVVLCCISGCGNSGTVTPARPCDNHTCLQLQGQFTPPPTTVARFLG